MSGPLSPKTCSSIPPARVPTVGDIRKRKRAKWIGQVVAVCSLVGVAIGGAFGAGALTLNSVSSPAKAPASPVTTLGQAPSLASLDLGESYNHKARSHDDLDRHHEEDSADHSVHARGAPEPAMSEAEAEAHVEAITAGKDGSVVTEELDEDTPLTTAAVDTTEEALHADTRDEVAHKAEVDDEASVDEVATDQALEAEPSASTTEHSEGGEAEAE